jgi:hypothetical protein
MTPTKADPLYARMMHAFGRDRVHHALELMIRQRDPLHHLTDDARDELMYRLISDLKLSRKFAAASRKHHREKQLVAAP